MNKYDKSYVHTTDFAMEFDAESAPHSFEYEVRAVVH